MGEGRLEINPFGEFVCLPFRPFLCATAINADWLRRTPQKKVKKRGKKKLPPHLLFSFAPSFHRQTAPYTHAVVTQRATHHPRGVTH
jgi:hypothetical protein